MIIQENEKDWGGGSNSDDPYCGYFRFSGNSSDYVDVRHLLQEELDEEKIGIVIRAQLNMIVIKIVILIVQVFFFKYNIFLERL